MGIDLDYSLINEVTTEIEATFPISDIGLGKMIMMIIFVELVFVMTLHLLCGMTIVIDCK